VNPLGTADADTITAPVLASALLGYEAANQDGQFGTVDGFLLDAFSGRVHSLLIHTRGPNPVRALLLPWGTFSIIASQPDQNPGTPAPAPQVWLAGSSVDLNAAPEANPEVLKDPGKLQPGWDKDLQAYWAGHLPQTAAGAKPTGNPPAGESTPTGNPPTGSPPTGSPPTGNPPTGSPPTGNPPTGNPPTGNPLPADQPAAYVFVQENPQSPLKLDVNSPAGDRIGLVVDLIIGQSGGQSGLAEFAILVPESALKLKQGKIPILWKDLAWSSETQSFVLNVPESVLAQAPDFTSAAVPDMSLPGWDAPWRDFWNNPPGGAGSGTGSVSPTGAAPAGAAITPTAAEQIPIRATTILGLPVVDRQGGTVGKIVDWTIDVQGRSNYALVVEESDGRILPLPWLALDRSHVGQPVVVVDRAVVDKAPTFAAAAELDANTGWRDQAFSYWQNYVQFPTSTSQRTREENALFLRLLQVLGGGVTDASKAMLGSLDDVILFPDGSIAYLVLHSGAILRPIPWIDFSYDFKTRILSYIDDPIRLENAPGFARLEDIHVDTAGWDDGVRAHWGMGR
jgi:hypothetical protein